MSKTGPAAHSIRAALKAATRGSHSLLHNDPVLSKLTDPDIEAASYACALSVFAKLYNAVEDARRACGQWARFTLVPECTALARDGYGNNPAGPTLLRRDRTEMLGALYVAHGAAFGRSVFRRAMIKALPDFPHYFLTCSDDQTRWRELLKEIELQGAHPSRFEKLRAGAESGFACVRAASIHGQNTP